MGLAQRRGLWDYTEIKFTSHSEYQPMSSFDVVSRTEIPEVDNAVQGAMREIGTRYDFKGSSCSVERADEVLTIHADDEFKLNQVHDILRTHMAKRKLDAGAFDFAKPETASHNTLRQTVAIKQGIEREVAQKITKAVKAGKLKVQVAIQGDELRVTGKKRDDLQAAIALIKGLGIDQPLQYVNFRD
jgi:uncharacterized protein YajQ (UPF0234 family)